MTKLIAHQIFEMLNDVSVPMSEIDRVWNEAVKR